jgi:hypothetical protein
MQRVILVHGIRDNASWYQEVRDHLESKGIAVETVGYGYFNLVQFLLPGPTRAAAVRRVADQIVSVFLRYPGDKISIIAFSFGTHVVAKVLLLHSDLKPSFLIFCGAVASRKLNWGTITQRVLGKFINECGTRDPWPLFAEAVTVGFSRSGTYGLQQVGVVDRLHNARHTPTFRIDDRPIYEEWAGVLTGDSIPTVPPKGGHPWWFRLISPVAVRSALALAALALAFPIYEPLLESWLGRCLFCDATTMSLTRFSDFRGSVCKNGKRTYENITTDSLQFSKYVDVYRVKWQGKQEWNPPVMSVTGPGAGLVGVRATQSACAQPAPKDCTVHVYELPVRGRAAKVTWTVRESDGSPVEEGPGGFSFAGRLPATHLTFQALLPPGVTFASTLKPADDTPAGPTEFCYRTAGGGVCDFSERKDVGALQAEERLTLPFSTDYWPCR